MKVKVCLLCGTTIRSLPNKRYCKPCAATMRNYNSYPASMPKEERRRIKDVISRTGMG
jgi:hypothetical protein